MLITLPRLDIALHSCVSQYAPAIPLISLKSSQCRDVTGTSHRAQGMPPLRSVTVSIVCKPELLP